MSAVNGDKSRFQVRRKAGLLRRQRSKEVQASLQQDAARRLEPEGDLSGGVRGRVGAPQLVKGPAVTE